MPKVSERSEGIRALHRKCLSGDVLLCLTSSELSEDQRWLNSILNTVVKKFLMPWKDQRFIAELQWPKAASGAPIAKRKW